LKQKWRPPTEQATVNDVGYFRQGKANC